MSLEGLPLPSPPPDSNPRGRMSGLFARALADKISSNVFSDPPDSEGDSAGRKRVGFHPWTTNILEPQLSTPDSEIPPSLKSLPPSRDCQLTVRPILKPSLSSQSVTASEGQKEKISALASMDSLLQNLAINERSSSVDAYQTMTSLIKTYDEAPEEEILQIKMTQLQKYIKRDLVVQDVPANTLLSEERLSMGNLIMSAMKVLVTVVWSPVYSPCMTDEFRAWTIDRAIKVLKEHSATKSILLHYIHLLATQDYRPSIMTQSRAQRILEVLQEMEEHISGKAVLSERLLVYQKLMQQSKSIMKAQPKLWIKHIFSAMGHAFKEVRGSAVSAGTEACTVFAGVPHVAAAARAALAEVNSDRTLSVSLTNRLERVLVAKDEANQIPQIWTLVLLLCNGGTLTIDSWLQLQDWLKLIQKCFNSSEMTVRVQAFLAWNRLYYVARPHEASEKVVSMLAKPAMIQLDKTGHAQPSKGSRQAVISSYCMLLYYAFRPSATSTQYTRMWNEFVVKLMTRSFLSKSAGNCDLSCRILSALFHSPSSRTRVWNENRAHENAALDPRELPAIDSKWLRSKTPSILSILHLIVEYSSFGPSGSMSDQAYAPQVWRHLMQAIKESTIKEVKTSPDTTAALNSIVSFLSTVNDKKRTTTDDLTDYAQRLSLLARITVEELGFASLLQIAKDSTMSVSSIVLQALVHNLLAEGAKIMDEQSLVMQCLERLNTDLMIMTRPDASAGPDTKLLMLQYAGDILEELAKYGSYDSLVRLQISVAHIIEDANNHFLEDEDTNGVAAAYRRFCNVVFELYDGIETSKQAQLMKLLSAATSSTHIWIRDFGFTRLGDVAASPRNQQLQSAASKMSPATLLTKSGSLHEGVDLGLPHVLSSAKSTASKSRKTKGKPKHEDSQVVFVPVESSPPHIAFESQLLTTRQKEVRARQNAEPAVTFGNIRSSPSVAQHETPTIIRRSSRLSTPNLPGTPTLPLPSGNDDEEQPPTPTPRARKSRRLSLQPEITSSPPSVSGDGQPNSSMNITSSPVKDVAEADGGLSFEDIDNAMTISGHEELDAIDNDPVIQVLNTNGGAHPDQSLIAGSVGKPSGSDGSTTEKYETAEPDRSSPTTCSDEFDALAASQLSQNLEETSFMTTNIDDEGTAEQLTTTRKRRAGQREINSVKKRRISPAKEDEVLSTKADTNLPVQEEDEEDTIYVSVEKTTPASLRVTRARAAQEASQPLQTSQRSSTSSTPGTKKPKGTRRRGRPKKGKRSQASQDDSPISQVQEDSASVEGKDNADTEMPDVDSHIDSPSLGSEVEETAESKAEGTALLEQIPEQRSGEETAALQHSPAKDLHPTFAEEAMEAGLIVGDHEDPSTSSVSIVANLQSILDSLNNDFPLDGKTLEANLATIHGLCFRIGLKAQELATR